MTANNQDDTNVINITLKKRCQPANYSLSPTEKNTKKHVATSPTEEVRRDPIMSYLGKLPRKRTDRDALISWTEHAKIIVAIESLKRLLLFVDVDTVLDVICEYEDPNPTIRVLAKKEEALWLNAEIAEEEPIPHFDFKAAHAHFKVPPEQRTNRVVFIKSEFTRPVEPPEVPLKLVKGEMYFFIVLRMYRRQYEKDFAAGGKKLIRSIDRLP